MHIYSRGRRSATHIKIQTRVGSVKRTPWPGTQFLIYPRRRPSVTLSRSVTELDAAISLIDSVRRMISLAGAKHPHRTFGSESMAASAGNR
jgi:hypothetical protein